MMINGVLHYIHGLLSIPFEENHVSCKYCPLLEDSKRYQCRGSGEYLLDINGRGSYCPISFEEENENGNTRTCVR